VALIPTGFSEGGHMGEHNHMWVPSEGLR
jgi:hypothetical protein